MIIKGKILFNLFFVFMFAFGLYSSYQWGLKARLFPQLIVIAGLAISLWNLIKEIIFERADEDVEDKPIKTETETVPMPIRQKTTPRSEGIMAMWVVIFFCMIILLGFWVNIIVFTALFMTMFGKENWKMVTIYTIGIWLLVYLTFHVGMKTSLYGGIFELAW
jgi:hypothetical protein